MPNLILGDIEHLNIRTSEHGKAFPVRSDLEHRLGFRLLVGNGLQHIKTRCPPSGKDGEDDAE